MELKGRVPGTSVGVAVRSTLLPHHRGQRWPASWRTFLALLIAEHSTIRILESQVACTTPSSQVLRELEPDFGEPMHRRKAVRPGAAPDGMEEDRPVIADP